MYNAGQSTQPVQPAQPRITYFYKGGCPYSRMTRQLILSKLGGSARIEPVCVDADPQGYKTQLAWQTGKDVQTFPQIFYNNRHVGGYTDLARMLSR